MPDITQHVVGDIGHSDLQRRPADPDGPDKELLLSFCRAKTCSTADLTFDRRPLAFDIVSGIGLPFGFF
ncbi:hypothetical protein [Hoeflea marina]|uniref:hypothetical protein n=1 Tax=Hoeflea marina TaxID=274592 RepID=UPI001304B10E|nr:hypothetical protein [Hoeflea marina]